MVTAFAVWLGVSLDRARQRQATVQAIRDVRATVMYDFQANSAGGYDVNVPSPLPHWLQTNMGDDFFYDVEWVDFFDWHWSGNVGNELSAELWAAIMPRLPTLANIRWLSIANAQEMSDESARYIGELRHLEMLSINDARQVTDETVSKLGRLSKLTRLCLTNSLITDESLRAIARLRLKSLDLTGSRLSDAGLAHLLDRVELESLCLGGDALNVTDDGMSSLNGLVSLEELDLHGADLTPKGMQSLSKFSKLKCLDLSNNRQMSDAGVSCLANLANLEFLYLQNTNVTSKGLAHLKRLKRN